MKKKNAKLHEEYFLKNDKKKAKRKSISTHSLNKLRMSEYGDSVKGTFHTISISKMSNQKSNSRLGKNKN